MVTSRDATAKPWRVHLQAKSARMLTSAKVCTAGQVGSGGVGRKIQARLVDGWGVVRGWVAATVVVGSSVSLVIWVGRWDAGT